VLSVTVPSLPVVSPHVVFLSVLFSVRFCSSYTRPTQYSHFISLSLNHHLHADDTQPASRDRDVDNFSRDETETRRWYVSRPSRDRDVETETTTLGPDFQKILGRT